jgi:6-phosphogluconolactonase
MEEKAPIVYTGSFQPQFKTSLVVDTDVDGKGDGIYAYLLDEESGELQLYQNLYGVINPAKLCLVKKHNRMYAASDTNEFINWVAGTGGGIYAFSVGIDGILKEVDRRSSCGVRAVDLCCDRSGQYLLVINEGSHFCTTEFIKNDEGKYTAHIRRDEGCVVLFRVNERGFERVCDRYVLPEGVPAHPHSMQIDADSYVYITNESAGTISILKLDTGAETLTPVATATADGTRGLGGIVRHPYLPLFYCTCEESGEVLTYRFDKSLLSVQKVQHMREEEKSNPGPIAISTDGNTVYTANSIQGEIMVYSVSQKGKLVLYQRKQCEDVGSFYDMTISPLGKWLLLSDMKNDCILSFPIINDGGLGTGAVKTLAKTPTGILMHSL